MEQRKDGKQKKVMKEVRKEGKWMKEMKVKGWSKGKMESKRKE